MGDSVGTRSEAHTPASQSESDRLGDAVAARGDICTAGDARRLLGECGGGGICTGGGAGSDDAGGAF